MQDIVGEITNGGTENVNAVITRLTKGLTAEQQSFALLKQGRLYLDQDDYDNAIEVLNKAITLNVSIANFIARASCYERLQCWTEAYFDYSFAIRLEPENGILYGHRGLCLAKLKKYDIAIDDLSKCVRVSPQRFYSIDLI